MVLRSHDHLLPVFLVCIFSSAFHAARLARFKINIVVFVVVVMVVIVVVVVVVVSVIVTVVAIPVAVVVGKFGQCRSRKYLPRIMLNTLNSPPTWQPEGDNFVHHFGYRCFNFYFYIYVTHSFLHHRLQAYICLLCYWPFWSSTPMLV